MLLSRLVEAVGKRLPDRRTILAFALIAIAVVVSLWAIVAIPPLLIATHGAISEADRLKAVNDLRGTLLTALAGAFAGGTLYFTARNLTVARRGQVTDRFSKAVDQLGQSGLEKAAVRIGAIYALEQIARDSVELRAPIAEMLTTLLRSRESATGAPVDFPTDLQAALSVIGRPEHDELRASVARLDLKGANLLQADLTGAQLVNADLTDADLRYARLGRCNLSGASLAGAKMGHAELFEANLAKALLTKADLFGADLRYSRLNAARLEGADLRQAQLVGADLRGANLASADLESANLLDADLRGADLRLASGLTFDVIGVARRDETTRLTAQTIDS